MEPKRDQASMTPLVPPPQLTRQRAVKSFPNFIICLLVSFWFSSLALVIDASGGLERLYDGSAFLVVVVGIFAVIIPLYFTLFGNFPAMRRYLRPLVLCYLAMPILSAIISSILLFAGLHAAGPNHSATFAFGIALLLDLFSLATGSLSLRTGLQTNWLQALYNRAEPY